MTADRFGNPNSAYDFDGINDIIRASNPFPLTTKNTDPLSLSVWIKTTSDKDVGGILTQHTACINSTDDHFHITLYGNYSEYNNNQLKADAFNAQRVAISKPLITDGNWHHIIFIYADGVAKLYMDSILKDSLNSPPIATFSSSIKLAIGGFDQSVCSKNDNFQGAIDDVRIYNRTLTEAEVKQLYESATPNLPVVAKEKKEIQKVPPVSEKGTSDPIQTIPAKYIFYFGLLMLILIALWILFLIFRYGYPAWKWGRFNEKGIRFFTQKEIDKAITCFESAMKIAEKVFGIKHPNYLMNLDNLAAGYYLIEKYDKAEDFYNNSLKIKEEIFGKEHPDYVKNLNDLSKLYMAMGEFRKAGPLAQQSLELMQEIFEHTYPDYALAIENSSVLADIDLLNGNFKDGLEKLLKIANLHDYVIVRMYHYSNEKKVQEQIRAFKEDYFKIITAISKHYSELKSYLPEVFDAILRRKTIALEIAAIYRDHVITSENTKLKKLLKKLRISRRALAFLIMDGCRELSPKNYKEEVCSCEEKIEAIENELIIRIPEFELRKKLADIDHNIIADRLPEKTTLVEFMRYESYDFQKRKAVAPCYVAFMISSQDKDNIRMINIGDASEIDELIRKYKETIAEEGRTIVVVHRSPPIAEDRLLIGNELYKKLFKPVANCIGDAERLLISPDGAITLLPFEVLPMPDGSYVVENFEISYIDSSRDLIRFQYQQLPQTGPVIMANPDFDLSRKSIFYYIDKILRMRRNIETISFKQLPGTMEEGTEIKKLLPKTDMKFVFGEQVLDKKVKKIRSPYIFHIATHGFVISEQDNDNNKLSRILKQFENPLLRSGLALAGANTFLNGKAVPRYAEDGLLIASDVTGMDMMGTELVVLSACQTGLGEVRAGEGIYGLRRAFTIAGARTQIVSLWNVPDQETKELMINFYTKLSMGKGKAQALREAQREMIAKLSEQETPVSPFLWGAFICVGHPDIANLNHLWEILILNE